MSPSKEKRDMSVPSVMMLCGVCGMLCGVCPWCHEGLWDVRCDVSELKVAEPRCTSPRLGDVSAQRVVVAAMTFCPWCMGDPNTSQNPSPQRFWWWLWKYTKEITDSNCLLGHWWPPKPTQDLPVPCPLGLQWLLCFRAPLGQTRTTQCLCLKETFSGGLLRLLTLSNVLSQRSSVGYTKLPADPGDWKPSWWFWCYPWLSSWLVSYVSLSGRVCTLHQVTHSPAWLTWLGALWHSPESAREFNTCKYIYLPLNISSTWNSWTGSFTRKFYELCTRIDDFLLCLYFTLSQNHSGDHSPSKLL